jgi:hypothetical protein
MHFAIIALLGAGLVLRGLPTDAADPLLLETFDADWTSRWTHSSQDKYTGRFKTDVPPGLESPALKVRGPSIALPCLSRHPRSKEKRMLVASSPPGPVHADKGKMLDTDQKREVPSYSACSAPPDAPDH